MYVPAGQHGTYLDNGLAVGVRAAYVAGGKMLLAGVHSSRSIYVPDSGYLVHSVTDNVTYLAQAGWI